MKSFDSGLVVCFAHVPESSGTSYTVADISSSSKEESSNTKLNIVMKMRKTTIPLKTRSITLVLHFPLVLNFWEINV
jgi:hypothetical protein